MKNKLVILLILAATVLSFASCVDDGYKKNSTGTFRSDNDDYVIPGNFIDVQDGEKKSGGDKYGDLIIIP